MDKYRNQNVDDFMAELENDLSAITGKQLSPLGVMKVLQDNRKDHPELTIDEAVIIAMRQRASLINKKVVAMATCMDRLTVMVRQMADHMEKERESQLYLNRLDILTDIDKVVEQLL